MSENVARAAREIRKDVLRMHRRGSNVGSALSAVDILAALYFDAMNIPAPDDPRRDRFILSKGHAAAALYATLAQRGFLDHASLAGFLGDGTPLAGHPAEGAVPGVEVSTGSLGHGLPIAVGLALAAKRDGRSHRVFVLMGCGEMQEGSVWEGVIQAARLGLDNLVAVVDANALQGYGRTAEIQPVETFAPRLEAFGWSVREVGGHDVRALGGALRGVPFAPGKPSAVVARTVMGKGVAEMEDRLEWHYRNVAEGQLQGFLGEVDGAS